MYITEIHFILNAVFRNAIFNFVNIAFNHGYIVHFNQLKTWILSRSLVFLLVWNGQDGMSVEVAVLFLYESLFTNGHMLNGRKLMLQKDYNMQTFCLPHFISVQSCSLNKKYNVKCFCFFLIIGLYWSYWIRLFYDASVRLMHLTVVQLHYDCLPKSCYLCRNMIKLVQWSTNFV